MAMFAQRIDAETPELHDEGVRMRFIGRREGVAPELRGADGRGPRQLTAANDRITLFVAFNYGGRAEIVDAAARFHGGDEEDFAQLLYAPEMHDPDLVIRTSGEQRAEQLPAVAVRLLRARVPRRAVARLRPRRRSRRRWRSTPRAAPLRGPLRRPRAGRRPASRRRADRARRRNAGGSDLGARILVAIPAIAFALFIVDRGRLDLHGRR